MFWDVPHHRGAGFPLAILRPVGVYSIMSNLHERPFLRPENLRCLLMAANAADAPLVGERDLSGGIRGTLGHLCDVGLLRRSVGGGRGIHTRYDLTGLGAGLIESLGPLTRWAMDDFDFVVAATRVRLGLEPLDGPVPGCLRRARAATGMAVSLMSRLWADTVMAYVDSAGPGGIGPLQLEEAVNAAIDASAGESRVERRLHRGPLYQTLHSLEAKGLLEHVEDPPRVRYLLTSHGRGLMDAWWQVAEDFGIPRDAELFRVIVKTTKWFPHALGD